MWTAATSRYSPNAGALFHYSFSLSPSVCCSESSFVLVCCLWGHTTARTLCIRIVQNYPQADLLLWWLMRRAIFPWILIHSLYVCVLFPCDACRLRSILISNLMLVFLLSYFSCFYFFVCVSFALEREQNEHNQSNCDFLEYIWTVNGDHEHFWKFKKKMAS